jgi:protein involved in polysaccharide export with SLBB domain
MALLYHAGAIRAQGLATGKSRPSPVLPPVQGSNQISEKSGKPLSQAPEEVFDSESRIGPDDLLDITVFEAPDLNRTLRVSANGEISFQLLGPIKAGGLTPRQLELTLQESLRRKYMKDPHVGVFVRELQSHPVSVVGAVKRPGVFQIRGTKTVLELLSMAEGLSEDAGDTVLVMRGLRASQSSENQNAEKLSSEAGEGPGAIASTSVSSTGFSPCSLDLASARMKTTQAEACATQPRARWLVGTQQIRAIPPRFLQRLLAAPAANFFVIAAQQNFGDRPAAEFGGTRVVGEIQEAVIRESLTVRRDGG